MVFLAPAFGWLENILAPIFICFSIIQYILETWMVGRKSAGELMFGDVNLEVIPESGKIMLTMVTVN